MSSWFTGNKLVDKATLVPVPAVASFEEHTRLGFDFVVILRKVTQSTIISVKRTYLNFRFKSRCIKSENK